MKTFIASFMLATAFALPALAQSSISSDSGRLIESYRAYISQVDIMNSNGEPLTQPWQIIRQDRANYHHFHLMDAGDDGDRFFADAANRQRMEAMLKNGSIEGAAAEQIISGDAHIRVDIYGHGNVGERIDVRVED